MLGSRRRLAFGVALTLLTLAGAGFARASVDALGSIATAGFDVSAIPVQLGPINELGRNGWQCDPERGAKAPAARDARLPTNDGR